METIIFFKGKMRVILYGRKCRISKLAEGILGDLENLTAIDCLVKLVWNEYVQKIIKAKRTSYGSLRKCGSGEDFENFKLA